MKAVISLNPHWCYLDSKPFLGPAHWTTCSLQDHQVSPECVVWGSWMWFFTSWYIGQCCSMNSLGPLMLQLSEWSNMRKKFWQMTPFFFSTHITLEFCKEYSLFLLWLKRGLVQPVLVFVFSAGLVQYSFRPRTEWHLNTYQTKYSLLGATSSLRQITGGTMTGYLVLMLL